jgi:hypothetical protein
MGPEDPAAPRDRPALADHEGREERQDPPGHVASSALSGSQARKAPRDGPAPPGQRDRPAPPAPRDRWARSGLLER